MVRLTRRDVRLLAKLAASRWLSTRQIAALIFNGKDPSIARRRLAQLAKAGYVHSLRTSRTAEVFHAVGREGKPVLAREGLSIELERTLPGELEHLKGINDIRVAVEAEGVPVRYFYAAWELRRFPQFRHVIPDAAFAIEAERKLRFLVEYDRAREPRKVLRQKVLTYQEGVLEHAWDGLLVIAETAARAESLVRGLSPLDLPARRFFVTDMSVVRTKGFFGSVFTDLALAGRGGPLSLMDVH